jgi:hypothetical protein|tara:strand:+ start:2268 stop:2672 length:405 start_codon:yes stop_codon:yes gene_type:complete
MATNAQWTVIFEDKRIIKQSGDGAGAYVIDNDSFWNDSKWSNIWAIQYQPDNHDYNDTVEHRDDTPHATWTQADLGDFQSQFIDKWDAAHLARLQSDWDNDNVTSFDESGNEVSAESEAEKIARLGERPTSYSS